MKYISHRGNINGKFPHLENTEEYIINAIQLGYDVEIDAWFENDNFYLGHDKPEHIVNINFLDSYKDKLWIHCKNIDALYYLSLYKTYHLFFHDKDDTTLTSKGYFWTYPGKKITSNSISVLPEIGYDTNIMNGYGICSDFIEKYRDMIQ